MPNSNARRVDNCSAKYKQVGTFFKTVGHSEMTAFISSNATFSLLSTIFAGYPTIARQVIKELAKYQIPAVAVPIAIITALHSLNVKHTKVPYRLVKSLMGAVGMTSFFAPLMMEMITRIIQIVEKESRSSPVWISNEGAAVIIGGCTAVGLLQAMQTYFLDIKAEYPEQPESCLSKATTNKGLRLALGAVNVASATYGAILASEKLLDINTESTAAYYSRSTITLLMGVIGAIILGNDESHSKLGTKRFLKGISLTQLYNLALAFIGTFLLSPAADSVFGNGVVKEQIWLWPVVIPLLISLLIGVNGCIQRDLKENNTDFDIERQCLINDSENTDDDNEEYINSSEDTPESPSLTIAVDPYRLIAGAASLTMLHISESENDNEHEHQQTIFSCSL